MHGKRLSDVVEVTWQHLKAAKRPICYLRALLANPVDFSHQLRMATQVRFAQEAKVVNDQRAEQVAKQSAGKTFVDVAGTATFRVSNDGESMTVRKANEGVERQAVNWKTGFAQALDGGFLRGSGTAAAAPVPTMPELARAHLATLRGFLKPRAAA
jgi:hypothetical protein